MSAGRSSFYAFPTNITHVQCSSDHPKASDPARIRII